MRPAAAGLRAACLAAIGVVGLAAAVTWPSTDVTATYDEEAGAFRAAFPFTVTDAAVDLAVVDSSCGCAHASFARTRYGPGTGGELAVRIDPRGKDAARGEHLTVRARTDAGERRVTLRIQVPDRRPIIASSRFAVWGRSDIDEERVIDLRAGTLERFAVLEATSSDPALAVRVETVTEGRHYRIRCTVDEHFAARADITVRTDAPAPRYARLRFYAMRDLRVPGD